MSNNTVSYAWTFAFLLLACMTVTLCWSATLYTAEYRLFVVLVLAGTSAVIIRTMYNVVMYENVTNALQQALWSKDVPLKQNISVLCPDYQERNTDENTRNTLCTNVFNGSTLGPKAEEVTTDLGMVTKNVEAWCSKMNANANDWPWLAMKKYCEYIGRN